jgi:hypothetical protein
VTLEGSPEAARFVVRESRPRPRAAAFRLLQTRSAPVSAPQAQPGAPLSHTATQRPQRLSVWAATGETPRPSQLVRPRGTSRESVGRRVHLNGG